ncbi:microviridin/marinostatin family tricyclic proteinase inhibitor [Rudanella paleaurantiibacter]|nr:microviridin/marinostatin family tricyclic proteinase inhibitor [Rudanella paleaurantiibacter]
MQPIKFLITMEQTTKKPFFARFLEGQDISGEQSVGADRGPGKPAPLPYPTMKYPSDLDEVTYPEIDDIYK